MRRYLARWLPQMQVAVRERQRRMAVLDVEPRTLVGHPPHLHRVPVHLPMVDLRVFRVRMVAELHESDKAISVAVEPDDLGPADAAGRAAVLRQQLRTTTAPQNARALAVPGICSTRSNLLWQVFFSGLSVMQPLARHVAVARNDDILQPIVQRGLSRVGRRTRKSSPTWRPQPRSRPRRGTASASWLPPGVTRCAERNRAGSSAYRQCPGGRECRIGGKARAIRRACPRPIARRAPALSARPARRRRK